MTKITAADIEQYERIRKRDNEFTEWRKVKAETLPEMAARVFALRGKGYMGCGFHWGLEKRLGSVICRLNDYDTPIDGRGYYNLPESVHNQIALEVMVEELEWDVSRLEVEVSSREEHDPEMSRRVAEYSNAVGRYGPDSEQAAVVRTKYADVPAFAPYADTLDRIKRGLGGSGIDYPSQEAGDA